jgi:hypothetical protein
MNISISALCIEKLGLTSFSWVLYAATEKLFCKSKNDENNLTVDGLKGEVDIPTEPIEDSPTESMGDSPGIGLLSSDSSMALSREIV